MGVAVVNPLAKTYRKHLIQGGPNQTAKFRGTRKRAKYWDLDKDKYELHPFIVESTGVLGPSALNLCATKGTVFFYLPGKVHFLHIFGLNRLNE